MTSRPSLSAAKQRPSSAIFLGSTPGSSLYIPDLPEPPEPPSPGGASNGSSSGLPSPPATNSTGSGSQGDNTTNFGSVRQRLTYSTSDAAENMHNGKAEESNSMRERQNSLDDEEDDENELDDNDEDDTARIIRRRSLRSSTSGGANQNILALQRVKSLNERNKMAIDKLSRLGTPSPGPGLRSSRSPQPPPTASSSTSSSNSNSSHRFSTHSHSRSESRVHNYEHDRGQSGSETERESQKLSHTYSSDDLSSTPPSSLTSSALRNMSSSDPRQRRISAPASPGKALARASSIRNRDTPSPVPSRTPRKRMSTVLPLSDDRRDREFGRDVTSAALAAVASSRRSPTGSGKKRQPLPREFMDSERGSRDGRASVEPTTPYRQSDYDNVLIGRGSPSPRSAAASFASNNSQSPRGPRSSQKSSLVRDASKRHSIRWQSEDLSASLGDRDLDDSGNYESQGRRQLLRGGSSDMVMTGRSLVGEGLRAAGITRRDGGDDVFANGSFTGELSSEGTQRRVRLSLTGSSVANGDVGDSPERIVTHRMGDGGLPPRTPHSRSSRASYQGPPSRASTSLGEYRGEDRDHPPSASLSRSQRFGTVSFHDRERERPGSASLRGPAHEQLSHTAVHDRSSVSPFHTTRRYTPLSSGGASGTPQQSSSEHGRLMQESLTMFEANLSRLPLMGNTTANTIPDVLRSAQNIVNAADKLNTLLRIGTNRALEEQIDAEVGDNGAENGVDLVEVWRKVGGEYRENLRYSDELVRALTGFMLGVGKVMKEATAVYESEGHSHSRSASYDDNATRRPSPEVAYEGASRRDGRQSSQSRRSWEPVPRSSLDVPSSRLTGRSDGSSDHARPASVLDSRGGRSDRGAEEAPLSAAPADVSRRRTVPALSSVRRLISPREQRAQPTPPAPPAASAAQTISSARKVAVQDNEPSPTPASRRNVSSSSRPLPPLHIPKPLPSLPSETATRRSSVTDRSGRRKQSSTSNVTVRPRPPFPTTISSKNATTAITPHTVSNSPERTAFPLLRANSGDVPSSANNVTFSRPTAISLNALNALESRSRTISASSSNMDGPSTDVTVHANVASPMSGSETERPGNRARTIGVRAGLRASLDGVSQPERNGSGSHHPASTISSAAKRERRRTVNELFS